MELSSIHHIDSEKIHDFDPDLFITTLGYETRCTTIARLFEDRDCRKIALSHSYNHLKEFSYEKNLDYFNERNYEIIPVETAVPDLGVILKHLPEENINIIFDCTSMSQRWYYEFFRWFTEDQVDYASANLRFVYTMANYVDPGPAQKVKRIKEFLKTEERTRRKKKRALILGLGHEENVCEAIYNIVKPDLLYLYYADPPVDKQFVEKVFVNNHALINATPIRNLIAYPLRNGQLIYQSLIDTILPLRNEYEITLVPVGPKIFSVVAMLVHLGYPDTLISYPVFKKRPSVDRHPSGEPVVLDVRFEGEE
ncbi:MAG: hypothetical protein KAR19_06930 [Bacteroidales bacterium]|nr:hypothetical protein [Bacteroidales bacterium]